MHLTYQYDVFLSYPREGDVGPWVHNHFRNLLDGCLRATLPHVPRIFIDTTMNTGVQWPQQLQTALLASKLLVAVWTPPFFRSAWCMAEWNTMRQREAFFASQGIHLPRGLVYPVVYSDGKHFPQAAKDTQQRRDLSLFTCPFPVFKESRQYPYFHQAVTEIAQEIEEHLDQVPPWQGGFPIAQPIPSQENSMALPQL